MQIKWNMQQRRELEDFANEHGLVLVVSERPPHLVDRAGQPLARFYASFEFVDVSQPSMRMSEHGNGSNPLEAVKDYAARISGKTLRTKDGITIQAPVFFVTKLPSCP